MFCRQCGQPNPDEAAHCSKCGAYLVSVENPPQNFNPYQAPFQMGPVTPPPGMEKPPTHMGLAITSTVINVFCCIHMPVGLVLGIIAIVFANQVDSKWYRGDFLGAIDNSKKARMLSLIALGIFGTIVLIIIIFVIVGVINGSFK